MQIQQKRLSIYSIVAKRNQCLASFCKVWYCVLCGLVCVCGSYMDEQFSLLRSDNRQIQQISSGTWKPKTSKEAVFPLQCHCVTHFVISTLSYVIFCGKHCNPFLEVSILLFRVSDTLRQS